MIENASIEVIRGAYKYLSQKWHPDKHPNDKDRAARIMKVINKAYSVLADPEQRKKHDDWIQSQREQSVNNNTQQEENISEQTNFFYKLASGEFGLAKTYWLYGVLVGVVASVLLNIITSLTGKIIFIMVYSIYQTFVLMGIWIASDRYKGLGFWAVLAKVQVVLGAIMLAVVLIVILGALINDV